MRFTTSDMRTGEHIGDINIPKCKNGNDFEDRARNIFQNAAYHATQRAESIAAQIHRRSWEKNKSTRGISVIPDITVDDFKSVEGSSTLAADARIRLIVTRGN